MDALEFTNLLVDAAVDKKASDVLLLDVKEQITFADYFLLVNGESSPQIKAIVDNVVSEARPLKERPKHVEGNPVDGWVLVDFGHVVVHVFAPDKREYYNLEELWQDARIILRMQ